MIRVNLLPKERVRRAVISPRTVILAGFAVLVVILIAFTLYLNARNSRLARESAQVQVEIDALRPQVARVQDLERSIAELREKQQLLAQLEAARVPWQTVLTEISQVIPRDVWLTQLSATQDGAVTLQGRGLSYSTVARFMLNLDASPFFDTVDLSNISKTKVGSRDVVQFSLTARLTPAAKEASR